MELILISIRSKMSGEECSNGAIAVHPCPGASQQPMFFTRVGHHLKYHIFALQKLEQFC